MALLIRLVVAVLPCLGCAADTLEPRSGSLVFGTVTQFAKNTFTICVNNRHTRRYSSRKVRRIEFDKRTAAAKVESRIDGMLERRISTYENGQFVLAGNEGTEKLPASDVEQIQFRADRGKGVEVIAKGGEVDIKNHLAVGNITIVDFYADWCGACKVLSPAIEELARDDPEVAIRKINIINWDSPVAKQYAVDSIPRIEIYNRNGKRIGTVRGILPDQVRQYVARAKHDG